MDVFLDAEIKPDQLESAKALDAVFRDVTGWSPAAWRKVIGYGRYDYTYASGRSGSCFATGFAIGAREISLHIMPGYTDFPDIAARLGPHRRGKSCWYLKTVPTEDTTALRDLISAGLQDLAGHWPVEAT